MYTLSHLWVKVLFSDIAFNLIFCLLTCLYLLFAFAYFSRTFKSKCSSPVWDHLWLLTFILSRFYKPTMHTRRSRNEPDPFKERSNPSERPFIIWIHNFKNIYLDTLHFWPCLHISFLNHVWNIVYTYFECQAVREGTPHPGDCHQEWKELQSKPLPSSLLQNEMNVIHRLNAMKMCNSSESSIHFVGLPHKTHLL